MGDDNYFVIPEMVIEDLCCRFLLNLPSATRNDIIAVMFQIEQAHWYYIDFLVPDNADLRGVAFAKFFRQVFEACPILKDFAADTPEYLREFQRFKRAVPTYGAVILDASCLKCVLVQSMTGYWGFPKGKINESEEPHKCAVREVYEETGFDISDRIDRSRFVSCSEKGREATLYIIKGVPLETSFAPRCRNEIKSIRWFELNALPKTRDDPFDGDINVRYFRQTIPFMRHLLKFLKKSTAQIRIPVDEDAPASLSIDARAPPASPPQTPRSKRLSGTDFLDMGNDGLSRKSAFSAVAPSNENFATLAGDVQPLIDLSELRRGAASSSAAYHQNLGAEDSSSSASKEVERTVGQLDPLSDDGVLGGACSAADLAAEVDAMIGRLEAEFEEQMRNSSLTQLIRDADAKNTHFSDIEVSPVTCLNDFALPWDEINEVWDAFDTKPTESRKQCAPAPTPPTFRSDTDSTTPERTNVPSAPAAAPDQPVPLMSRPWGKVRTPVKIRPLMSPGALKPSASKQSHGYGSSNQPHAGGDLNGMNTDGAALSDRTRHQSFARKPITNKQVSGGDRDDGGGAKRNSPFQLHNSSQRHESSPGAPPPARIGFSPAKSFSPARAGGIVATTSHLRGAGRSRRGGRPTEFDNMGPHHASQQVSGGDRDDGGGAKRNSPFQLHNSSQRHESSPGAPPPARTGFSPAKSFSPARAGGIASTASHLRGAGRSRRGGRPTEFDNMVGALNDSARLDAEDERAEAQRRLRLRRAVAASANPLRL